jgi:putative membrane protein insertion efficiency factor
MASAAVSRAGSNQAAKRQETTQRKRIMLGIVPAGVGMQFLWATLVELPGVCLIAVVRTYQVLISPWLPRACRFQPSCSSYMIGAIMKYGFLRGGWRGVKRICRCHPFGQGGFDPP